MPDGPPAALVLYHYLYPDDIVSAVCFTELCEGLVRKGWSVTASACNRSSQGDERTWPGHSSHAGVQFRRIWRPPFRQASSFGRIANAIWMIAAWSLMALNPRLRPKVLIIGTDPVLSPLVAFAWRLLRPGVRIAHWCFDLYPEAAIAAGLIPERSAVAIGLKRLLVLAYRRCDIIVDIGPCMRQKLEAYRSPARTQTITPWALVEPAEPAPIDPMERRALFGDANLCLLYSGSFGLAHSWRGLPELSFALQRAGGKVAFSVRGNGTKQMTDSVRQSGAPVVFAPFVEADRLKSRLSAADIHIVSLREEWTGTVVPSKFFGALAIGRPVLFIGSRHSAIARWIEQLHVGWILDPGSRDRVIEELVCLCRDIEARHRLFKHCHQVYNDRFGRAQAIDCWDRILR